MAHSPMANMGDGGSVGNREEVQDDIVMVSKEKV